MRALRACMLLHVRTHVSVCMYASYNIYIYIHILIYIYIHDSTPFSTKKLVSGDLNTCMSACVLNWLQPRIGTDRSLSGLGPA